METETVTLVGRHGVREIEVSGSSRVFQDVDLRGDRRSLMWLAAQLRKEQSFSFPLVRSQDVPVEPYETLLESVEVLAGEGLLEISVRDNALRFTGDPMHFSSVAVSVESLAKSAHPGPIRDHVHEEYYDGHPFLAPTAVPLIISKDEGEFVAYVGDARVHDATIASIEHDGASAVVMLQSQEGYRFRIRFQGVASIAANRAEGMMLYALSEMTAPPPLRRFVFANWDEDDDAFLEIVAAEVET